MNDLCKWSLIALAAGVSLFASASANAQFLYGSLPLAGLVTTENGPNLLAATKVSTVSDFTSGHGIGDYSPIPLFTTFHATPLILANPSSFSISNATWGHFNTSAFMIVDHAPFFYEVRLLGTYTPGPGMPGKLPTSGVMRISINQSGKSLSEAITLATPPSVPEPGNVALLTGSVLSGAGFLIRKRRK